MTQADDLFARYCQASGYPVERRTILFEGTTDVALLNLAARLERQKTGENLLDSLSLIAAGEKDRGGTTGVIRELNCLRSIASRTLSPQGSNTYRVIGAFDDDSAGRKAVKAARDMDASIIEYKDIFRIRPEMPRPGNLDPKALGKAFDDHNLPFKGMEWEIEDLLGSSLVEAFLDEYPSVVRRERTENGKTHRDFSPDGKARLHRYVSDYAIWEDVRSCVELLRSFRYYLGLR